MKGDVLRVCTFYDVRWTDENNDFYDVQFLHAGQLTDLLNCPSVIGETLLVSTFRSSLSRMEQLAPDGGWSERAWDFYPDGR